MPRCNHSHRETAKSVWMCAESTATVIARERHRGAVRHASAHTEQRMHPAEQKHGERRMTPRAGNTLTHGGHRAAASTGLRRNAKGVPHASINGTVIPAADTQQTLHVSTEHASQRPAVAKAFLQSTVQILICVCAGGAEEKRSTGRHINSAKGTVGWQQHMRYGPNLNNHARWQHTPVHKKKKTTRRQGVAVCVCVALRVSARPGRKKKTRKEEMCAPPHRPSSHAHTSRLPQRAVRRGPSSCVQQARRTGPVVMSVSVGVRVEQLGGKYTAPLAGRVQQETIDEIRKEKKKPMVVATRQQKKKGMGV
ncbi:hypothetical protein MOQ_001176 [Trypanosoma cruzi marinkellei]|uniref:Uncharacterized protein n=1 Tax=Trypanosoma cruzi marinkellei TaxID=85056 RepID=K2MTS7_TRYCR|nr:hypothetical protein MOQ_001176 [Trypanosoma cruzi marinkellei]